MPKFTYNDVVRVKEDAAVGRVKEDAAAVLRRERAWVVGIFEERPGPYFEKFPEGVVYTIEFEDGTSREVHESGLEADHLAAKTPQDDQTRYG